MPPNLRGHLQQAGPLFRFIQLKLPKALFAVALLMLAGTGPDRGAINHLYRGSFGL